MNPSWWHWLAELARESQRETNGATCATAHLERLSCASAGIREAQGRRHVDTKVHFMQAWANGTWTTHLEGAW